MDDYIRGLIQEVKNVHIDRRNEEKMDRRNTADRPQLKEFVNNLDVRSDSSEDNSLKQINSYLSDKGERYGSSKMPNLNLPQEMSGKTGDAKTWKTLGAIPKKPNNYFAPRRNRDNSAESNRSCTNRQRKPNAAGGPRTGRNNEGKRREIDLNKKVFKRDYNSHFKQGYPFYYKVPENPVDANPLPPGTYLVIPQTSINFLPLKIISHAPVDSSEGNNRKGKCEAPPSGQDDEGENTMNENDEEKKKGNKICFDKEDPIKTQTKGKQIHLPRRDLDANGNPPGSHDPEKPNRQIRRLFSQYLPFYDTDGVLYEFYERGMSVEEFVIEMVQRKKNEIQDRIFQEFPDIDVDYLEEYIMDALKNYKDVEDFIKDRKRKEEKELESVTRELPDIDEQMIKDIHDRYKGIEHIE